MRKKTLAIVLLMFIMPIVHGQVPLKIAKETPRAIKKSPRPFIRYGEQIDGKSRVRTLEHSVDYPIAFQKPDLSHLYQLPDFHSYATLPDFSHYEMGIRSFPPSIKQYEIELTVTQYFNIISLVEKTYNNIPMVTPCVVYDKELNRVKLTLPIVDSKTQALVKELSKYQVTNNDDQAIDNDDTNSNGCGCPLILSRNEELWVGRLLLRYQMEPNLPPLVAEDIKSYAPKNSLLSINKDSSIIVYIPATYGAKVSPIVFATDFKAGGAATLVKLLCSLQNKNIAHGEIFLIISASRMLEREIQELSDCISVLISKNELSHLVSHDIDLYYLVEHPSTVLNVVRMCEKIIINEGLDEANYPITGALPALPSLFQSEVDSLMNRLENYLAANTSVSLKKRLNDDISELNGDVEFEQFPNGDFLLHLFHHSYNCRDTTPMVFLSHMKSCAKIIDNPEQHIDSKMKKYRIIKSDGEGCLGLNSRVGVTIAMELMRLLDADTSKFHNYYVLFSNSNQPTKTNLKTIIKDEVDTVIVFNDGWHQINNEPTLTVVSHNFNIEIKHENTERESVRVKSLAQVLEGLLNNTNRIVP